MKKEILGQPLWLWAVGAAVIVGGYLYIRHQQSAATPGQGGTGSGSTASPQDTSSFNDWIEQHDASPGTTPKSKHHPKVNPGGPNKPGPERQWLIKKTGSKHPWSFLDRHHEQIRVGPERTRRVVKDG